MNDTAPEVSAYLHERYAAMSTEERFLIGIRMFDTARAIVKASFPTGLSEAERRRELCRRFYPSLAERVFPGYGPIMPDILQAQHDIAEQSNAAS